MRFRCDPAGSLLAVVAGTMALSALAGCYTVLRHPRTEVTQTDYSRQDCYSCHRADGPAHAYDPLAVPTFGYYGDALYGYYAYPWWRRNYWYSDDYGYSGGWRDSLGFKVPIGDDSRRHLWGRGDHYPSPLPPIYGVPGGNYGNGAPVGGQTGTSDAPAATQDGRTLKPDATNGAPPAPAPPPEKKKDDKKKDDKTNVWGRGGGR